jgi:hypothetical protein
MTNFKIFLRDGKLWGNEFPEIPAVSISANQDAARMRSYNRSVESACATAIEVIGIDEDALILNGFACEDDFYSVPTGWTVDVKGQYWTGPPVPEWMDIDNGMTVYEGLETRKIARLIPSKVDSPVIPEGSEKQKFEVLLYGEWVELSENQYLQAINNNHYGRINGVEQNRKSADKPAIDDTLKGKFVSDPVRANETFEKLKAIGEPPAQAESEIWHELMTEWESASFNLSHDRTLEYLKSKFTVTRKTV